MTPKEARKIIVHHIRPGADTGAVVYPNYTYAEMYDLATSDIEIQFINWQFGNGNFQHRARIGAYDLLLQTGWHITERTLIEWAIFDTNKNENPNPHHAGNMAGNPANDPAQQEEVQQETEA